MLPETYYLTIIVSIIGLIIATYTDLKERIVPNKLNYGLAIIGLIIFAIDSIIEGKIEPLLFSITGLLFGFAFGWILWKLGVFAGGDVKLFMALGTLNPFTPALINSGILKTASIPFFPITLFICSLIAFLPYGIIVIAYKIKKNKEYQKELWKEMKPKTIEAIHTAIIASAGYTILMQYTQNAIIITPALIATLAIWELFKEKKKYLTIVGTITAIILNTQLFAAALITAILISVIGYTLIKLMFSTKKLLSTEIKVEKLEEGMIPAKSLLWKGKKVKEEEEISLKQIIKYIKKQDTSAITELLKPKKEIISAKKARGLTKEELRIIKKLAKEGKIPKTMRIKESMPFVPTMLIGYIICTIIGDAALFMLIGVI
jgi:preflagellin peptidase FlaK